MTGRGFWRSRFEVSVAGPSPFTDFRDE